MSRELTGESINEFRSKSFYMDGLLVSEHLMLFFDIEGVWYSLTIVDGSVHLKRENCEPALIKEFDKGFAYPISNVEILNAYVGLKVKSVYAYQIIGIDEGLLGLYISFGGVGFSYYNVDDFSYLRHGLIEMPNKKPAFMEYKLSLP
jgi:hypothetical protein